MILVATNYPGVNSSAAAKKQAQFIGEDENVINLLSANGTITGAA